MEKALEKLAINGGEPAIKSNGTPHYVWPVITGDVEKAVLAQLRKEVSIYNRSGVFAQFEDEFKKYHDRKFALVTSSGTAALFGAYEALALKPGDEVICPNYTFFATASPAIYTGAKLVFVDCGDDGNVDPAEIEKAITKKTKAVVVTHMWGIPCDMPRIKALCEKHKISLIEDCSHAHGAKVDGKRVGTFGDIAIWSLQAQKIITGGEGGIFLTDNEEFYIRAQLQGQYNKRCRDEIPQSHPLYKFALTGFGLKLRAHPLAIAMALQQFRQLDKWLDCKNKYAARFVEAISKYEFLRPPLFENKVPSWYAFVFHFAPGVIPNLTIERFMELLKAEGLVEADRPTSTCPLSDLPLFATPWEAMPRLYQAPPHSVPPATYPRSDRFFGTAIKLPVWAFPEDEQMVNSYIHGLTKVCDAIVNHGAC